MIKLELDKQRKRVWCFSLIFPILLNVLLYLDLTFRYRGYLLLHMEELGLSNWQLIFKEQSVFYFSELFYVVLALIIYEIFSLEFKNDAWLILISSPFRNKLILNSKIMIVLVYIFTFWLADYISLFIVGRLIDGSLAIDLRLFLKSFIVQFLSSTVIILFYFLILIVIKKISSLIPISILMMITTISIYYKNPDFKILFPFTYISHAFRVTNSQFLIVLLVNTLLIFLLYHLLKIFRARSYEIKI